MDLTVTESEALRHNPLNEVTGSIDRVRTADGRILVRKQLRAPGTTGEGGVSHWRASDDPAAYQWWRREAEVYADDALRDSLEHAGLSLPQATVQESPDGATLWLDWVDGRTQSDLTMADYRDLAVGLGRWQANAGTPSWASKGFLRAYEGANLRAADDRGALALLTDDEAWRRPLVADNWPPGLRGRWAALVAGRGRMHAILAALPRALCHLDVWASNVIVTDRPVLVDWAFAGDGAVGEDVGNAIPDACFDLFFPADRVRELDATMTAAYLDGLSSAGWRGDRRTVRLGITASCVKYTWLVLLLLEHATEQTHQAYHREVDATSRYRACGQVFDLLTDWYDEALALSDELGIG